MKQSNSSCAPATANDKASQLSALPPRRIVSACPRAEQADLHALVKSCEAIECGLAAGPRITCTASMKCNRSSRCSSHFKPLRPTLVCDRTFQRQGRPHTLMEEDTIAQRSEDDMAHEAGFVPEVDVRSARDGAGKWAVSCGNKPRSPPFALATMLSSLLSCTLASMNDR